MDRAKLFISYSHRDTRWVELLNTHLAILMRWGLVHVWSDTRIEIGSRWREEIEVALSESAIALLVITPDFLASEFIWSEEMPELLKHQDQGMWILPLIVRPCAWRIAPSLAELQVRPANGGALALGTTAEIDRELTQLVYEIAGKLKQLPDSIASKERDFLRSTPPVTTTAMSGDHSGLGNLLSPAISPIEAGQTWEGAYQPTGRQLRLVISLRTGSKLSGQMQYDDDGSATEVVGEVHVLHESRVDTILRDTAASMDNIAGTATLREIRIIREGRHPPQLDGEYLALVGENAIKGVWRSAGIVRGHFELNLSSA